MYTRRSCAVAVLYLIPRRARVNISNAVILHSCLCQPMRLQHLKTGMWTLLMRNHIDA